MTEAVSAQGEMLFVEKTEGVWTQINELKGTPEIGGTAGKIDATTLASEMKEYIKDIPDQPDLEFTFNIMPVGSAGSNLDVLTALSRNGTYRWKWVAPQIGKQVIWTGGFFYRFGAGAVSSVKDLILTIIPRTAPVESDIGAKYAVTYDANGGTGTMDDPAEYDNGDEVTIKECTFIPPEGKTFTSWNTKADGTGTAYDGQDTFRIYKNTTLYVIWSE